MLIVTISGGRAGGKSTLMRTVSALLTKMVPGLRVYTMEADQKPLNRFGEIKEAPHILFQTADMDGTVNPENLGQAVAIARQLVTNMQHFHDPRFVHMDYSKIEERFLAGVTSKETAERQALRSQGYSHEEVEHRMPYRVMDADLINRYRDTRVAHDESAKEFIAHWGAPGFLRADGGRPMGLLWTGDDMARIEPGRYSGFSFKNEWGGRAAYPRRSAKAVDKQAWQQSVDKVKLWLTDYELSALCGWTKHRHEVMHNSRVHFPVALDFESQGLFLLLPRQLGDNWEPNPEFLKSIRFEDLDTACTTWKASRAD